MPTFFAYLEKEELWPPRVGRTSVGEMIEELLAADPRKLDPPRENESALRATTSHQPPSSTTQAT